MVGDMKTPGRRLVYPWSQPPESGTVIEVARDVFWLRLPLPMALDHVNVYALDDGVEGWSIVDTGFHSAKSVAIWNELLAHSLAGKPVRRVVVTHHHPDHIGNAGWFQLERGAELVTTRTAWLFARMLVLDVQDRVGGEKLDFWRSSGMVPEAIRKRRAERPFNFADTVASLPLGFRRISQGDEIVMGGRRWAVHTGDGHAPEHATFWSLDDSLVLAGDQVLSTITPNLGVYPTEPEADPVGEWMETCRRLQTLARPEHLVLCGHRLPFVGLSERLRQLVEHHTNALDRLRDHLAVPRSAAECFAPLFGRQIGDREYELALCEAAAHCNHLHQTGAVIRERRSDGAWLYRST